MFKVHEFEILKFLVDLTQFQNNAVLFTNPKNIFNLETQIQIHPTLFQGTKQTITDLFKQTITDLFKQTKKSSSINQIWKQLNVQPQNNNSCFVYSSLKIK